MHHDRHVELARELPGCRKMVCMGVGVDQVSDPQTVSRGQGNVTIDLTELRINQCRGAALLAADEIRPASAAGHRLEDHWTGSRELTLRAVSSDTLLETTAGCY